MKENVETVLDFWFGESPDDRIVAEQKSALWWSANSETDRIIHERFAELREAAITGKLDDALQTPEGRLALIILVDQFSRNLFRNYSRAYTHDALARAWTLEGLAQAADRKLRPSQRLFFYLPLEHSESIAEQDHSVALFQTLSQQVSETQRALFENFLDYAEKHRAVIARFGRFPHRNAVLGRESTAEEIEFLKQPGAAF